MEHLAPETTKESMTQLAQQHNQLAMHWVTAVHAIETSRHAITFASDDPNRGDQEVEQLDDGPAVFPDTDDAASSANTPGPTVSEAARSVNAGVTDPSPTVSEAARTSGNFEAPDNSPRTPPGNSTNAMNATSPDSSWVRLERIEPEDPVRMMMVDEDGESYEEHFSVPYF